MAPRARSRGRLSHRSAHGVKTEPIVAAGIDFASGPPRASEFGDVYHPREGALEQARAVFLAGNGLPERWRGRARFTILETGFGLGHNFLATWAAWRDDPRRCERLYFVSLEKHPPTRGDLARALSACALPPLAQQLVAAWPPLTPNLHSLAFEGRRVQLLLGFGDAATLARELVAQADAFFLDGFAPAKNPAIWSEPVFAALARLAAPGATAATWSAARIVRDGLRNAGFSVEAASGPGTKRDITLAQYAPRFVPPRPLGRIAVADAPREAIIVGGGLAGAATARALTHQGVRCTVLDAEGSPAARASGNPAALFHGTVGTDDTHYTRLHRAASLHAAAWLREHPDCGASTGLLRLNSTHGIDAMRALLHAQRLPQDYVKALDPAQASTSAGLALAHPAWCFSQGGWADPAALVHATFDAAGVSWRGSSTVQRVQAIDGGWCVLGSDARVLGEAPLVVIAAAHDALRLTALPARWNESTRGQVSWLQAAPAAPRLPLLPIASGGYALALPDGRLLFGATQQADDDDRTVREEDHALNRRSLRQLCGISIDAAAPLQGRVAWRSATRDRLPLAGALPDFGAAWPLRRDAPRLVPRRAGQFIHSALGARGLTLAALCGELIAAQAVGAPWPLEADLADAIDPARLALRG
jgi:tRNA 5-methylaminomethyl-2-thiouridine biosynthesis bifunctional protein